MPQKTFYESKELKDIMKNNLMSKPKTQSVKVLLNRKRRVLNFNPYYQRNYVWDPIKATNFIESVLLGVEIPPLILFKPKEGNPEVIDGRQRFETLKRFYDGDLKLTRKGLTKLKTLAGYSYTKLDSKIQETFERTTLRTIEFWLFGNLDQRDHSEDIVKKEIFWRYNSGLTPLRKAEIEQAKYLDDNLTNFLKDHLTDSDELRLLHDLFFPKLPLEKYTVGVALSKLRTLLVMHLFPINRYAGSTNRNEHIEKLYEYYSNDTDFDELLGQLRTSLQILGELLTIVDKPYPLIYESIFWSMSVLRAEGVSIEAFMSEKRMQALGQHILKKIGHYFGAGSSFYRETLERYEYTAAFFKRELDHSNFEEVNFAIYLKNTKRVFNEGQNLNKEEKTSALSAQLEELNNMRLNRPDAVTEPIEEILEKLKSSRFMLRPPYQRQQVISPIKMSGIIESILLGVPLPTIFVYRYENEQGTVIEEVVDGQQRLISILAYTGEKYKNETGREELSERSKFRLPKNINIMTEVKGLKFEELDEKYQNQIYDFDLSIVYIDQKLNPDFDPIDQFIRLNNKPYPVRANTFEMWNSYMNREIIEKVKNISRTYDKWFYYRINNKRMVNEELLMVFTFFEFAECYLEDETLFDQLIVFQTSDAINIRIKRKESITDFLKSSLEIDQEEAKHQTLVSIDGVEKVIQKIEALLEPAGGFPDNKEEYLKKAVDELLNMEKAVYRSQKNLYGIWIILTRIRLNQVKKHKEALKEDIKTFYKFLLEPLPENNVEITKIFKNRVEAIWNTYIQDAK